MRLIDADELLLRFIPRGGDNPFTRFVRETVRLRVAEMPTIEAEPKRGRWETTRPDAPMFGFYYCSLCGRKRTSPQDNFCPNCGADMREVEE